MKLSEMKTQADINAEITRLTSLGDAAATRRDRETFESKAYWRHHDVAVKWWTRAEALMPGGSVWVEKAKREGRRAPSSGQHDD